ncbi:MAG: hypothetical protein AVDCRST_MAG50-1422, partial [uncultured Acidimicrobiales bacterium]
VRAQPLPPPRRLRCGRRPGRAHHHDGAHGHPSALPLLSAEQPLRAATPRPPPPRPLRSRPVHGLRHHQPRGDRHGDGSGDGDCSGVPPRRLRRCGESGSVHRRAAV